MASNGDMGIELSPPAFTTPLGYTYHIGDRISSIELDHIAAVGVIARVDEDHVWHTLPNVPGQEPVSIDRNSFERYLDTRYSRFLTGAAARHCGAAHRTANPGDAASGSKPYGAARGN